ncbi:MAG: DegT/DnrJ/EryC1/StrS family aminotransferase, partial [Sinomicrobium sp.]|nr:DegT/DnrJ/EryC1/StrS family aminotransferase [Sinomicrobium sp.]
AHNLYVIEDNAQAIGATYSLGDGSAVKAGTMGHLGTTSFFPSKNLGCYGDGGGLFTNDDDLARTVRGIVNHGMYKRYYHDVIGVNSRLDTLQAAVLSAKLPFLDDYNRRRREAAAKYDNAFKDRPGIITPVQVGNAGSHVYHQYTLRITNGKRDALAAYLSENKIPYGIYYPVPLHRQEAYKDDRYNEADFPVTNRLVNEVISLPMHTELDEEQIHYITSKIIAFLSD